MDPLAAGFCDVPVQGDCEARVPARMWSEEKGVYITSFGHLPCSLKEEARRAVGVTADNWMFQPASGYSVWFMLNAWEMAKLRAYYLHGPWQDAVELWTGVWSSWLQGPHPFPETTAPSMPCCSDFRNSLGQTLLGAEGHPCHSMAFKNAIIACKAANSRFTLRVHQGLDLERHALSVAPHWKNSGPPGLGLAIPFLLIFVWTHKTFWKTSTLIHFRDRGSTRAWDWKSVRSVWPYNLH